MRKVICHRGTISLLIGVLGLWSTGCGRDEVYGIGRNSSQNRSDGGPGSDGALDASSDAGGDGAVDSGFDGAIVDSSFDGGRDSGVDGGRDSGVDGGRDSGVDGGRDGGPDSGIDGGPDSGIDGGRDSGIDGGPDSGVDGGSFDAGTCADVDCTFLDGPCTVGACNPNNRQCFPQPRPPGTACEDGNPCTVGDVCRRGTCRSGGPLDCSALSNACNLGVCEPVAGGCVALPVPNGTPCNDGNGCTFPDACLAGMCMGTPDVPPGDTCSDVIPVPIVVGTQVETGNTECASDAERGSCYPPNGRDIVYGLNLDGFRRVIYRTVSPSSNRFDTAVHVRSTCTSLASELACNDDGPTGLFSFIDRVYPAGQQFAFVDGVSGAAQGDYVLEIEIDPQDTCANPSILPFPQLGQSAEVVGITTGAANTFQASCASQANSPDHVYSFTVPTRSRLIFETLSPTFPAYDTALHVRTACAPGNSGVIACDDDAGQGTLSRLDLTLEPGTYFVVVDGWSTNSQGHYRLSVTNAPLEQVRIFPDVGDARLTQVGTTFSQDGDFVEGIRNVTLTSVTRMTVNIQITNNLTCNSHGTQAMINGVVVGNFTVFPGQTSVTQTFMFPPQTGPNYALRYETTRDIPTTCGSIDFPNGVSTVTLGN